MRFMMLCKTHPPLTLCRWYGVRTANIAGS
nr:MAG TPA_asm: hypothetical protein [Caudoviricetes sp.]